MAEQQNNNLSVDGGNNTIPPYRFDTPVPNDWITGPKPFNVNPALYDIDKVAYQSGAKDMWNSFIQGVNQTQIGTTQYDLFKNQKRIADIEGGISYRGELQKLESDFLNKKIDEVNYLTKKDELLTELNSLYTTNNQLQNDILSDEGDIEESPVSKSYQIRQQLLQGMGSDAGFLESLVYTQPSVIGSSAATMGATIAASFGSNFAKKIASRVVASAISGPAAPVVAVGLTLASIGGTLYYARDLESRAEVGGAIQEDYELAKESYLVQTGKNENELTPEEHNELITQAYKGADRQYWKNMSLAAVDAVQALALGAGISNWFSRISNINKFTRAGARIGEWYIGAKSEAVEEGLQYAFQKEKNQASLGTQEAPEGFANFITSLRQDYADVLGSLNYGPIKGTGKYSDDKEFQFATDAGFIMGSILGGSASIVRTAKDLFNYRNAAKELQKAGVENVEGNVFKFNTQIYKSFFEPTSGVFGESSEDRVHFLREAVKAMGKKKDANGQSILTPEEVRTELDNIGEAYRVYSKLRSYLDNSQPGYSTEQANLYKLASEKYENAIFSEAMQRVNNSKNLTKAQQDHASALLTIDPTKATVVDLNNKIRSIDRRINQLNQLQVGEQLRNDKVNYLQSRKKELTSQLNQELQFLKDAGVSTSMPPATPDLFTANDALLTQEMFTAESDERYNNLLKVNSFKRLSEWYNKVASDEFNAGLTGEMERIQQMRAEEYTNLLASRKQYDLLTDEEERERQKENKAILLREGFTQPEIDSMGYEDLERTVNDILNTYARGGFYLNENQQYRALSQVQSQQEYQNLFNNPGFQNFIDRNFPNTDRNTPYTQVSQQAKDFLKAQREATPKKVLPPTTTGTYTSTGRPKNPSDVRTASELHSDLGVRNGRASQSSILNNIINSPYSTDSEKSLARELLKVTEADDVIIFTDLTSPGLYNGDNNTVSIDVRYSAYDYANSYAPIETVILHELIHKYTVAPLQADPNSDLAGRLNNLFNFVSDQARRKNVFDKFYGLSNRMEFLSEGMTNPELQEFLKTLSYTVREKTAWEEFLDFINATLRSLGIVTDQTTLDEVVSITSGLVERANRESFSSIRSRVESRINSEITSSKTVDENIDAAEQLYKDLYDQFQLSPAEFSILETAIKTRLETVNKALEAKDKSIIKFGKWTFREGEFVVPTERNTVYTVAKQNPNKTIIVSYEFTKDGKKQSGSRTLNSPDEISQVFPNKQAAFDYIKGRAAQPVGTQQTSATAGQKVPLSDSFSKALDDFIKYSKGEYRYGTLDPRLIELGNNLIREAVKIGKTNFRDISSEIINRVGQEDYKAVFENLRAVYNALFAITKGLDDTRDEMSNLVNGDTTAQSIIDSLNPPNEDTTNTYTGSVATPVQEKDLASKNAQDKITGELYKSTGQQFLVDTNGRWTNEFDTDPVKVRYYSFVRRMLEQSTPMSKLGYFGLVVQDGENATVGGVSMPHEVSTIRYIQDLKSKGKPVILGQVVVITDQNGNPIKFDQQGNPDPNGDLIVFNIERPETAAKKNVNIVAKVNGVSEESAKELIRKSSNEISAIRDSARSGKPVLLSLSPKAGVPVFTDELNSASPLSNKNYTIEIATVRKDDTNIGYFTQHPNSTGFLGGAYVFVNEQPIKIEPNTLTEASADLIVTILDEQTGHGLSDEQIKSRSKFLKDLVYQRYTADKNLQQGTFYFKGSDIYMDGAKVAKADRKNVLLQRSRYNVASYLLNKNWTPYFLREGKIVKAKPTSYNKFILSRSSTRALLDVTGVQETGNAYFTYKREHIIEPVLPIKSVQEPQVEFAPSAQLNTPFTAKTARGGKPISVEVMLNEVDFDATGIDGLDVWFKQADSLLLTSLKIAGSERTGKVFVNMGEGSNSGSVELPIVFKSLPAAPVKSPVESVPSSESTSLSEKKKLVAKLKAQNEAARKNNLQIDDDVKGQMTSLGRSIDIVSDTDEKISQVEIDWFNKTFFKSYSGDNAARELRITGALINSNLWGEFSENGIRLFKDAPQGTLYHEAWHEFTQVYLTLEEKQSLYKEARQVKGLKGKSDLEVEEYLAESFRNYVLTDKTPVAKNLFQRILNYIRSIFFGTTDIDTLFERLRKGKINNYLPNINNIQFKRLNSGITNSLGESLFDATQSLVVVRSIDRLIYDFIYSYGKNVIDTLSQPKILQAAYKAAYTGFNENLINLREQYIQKIENAVSEEEISNLLSELQKSEEKFTRVTNNWNDVVAYHGQHSKTFIIKNNEIKFAFDDSGNLVEENDDANVEKSHNSWDALSGNEISSIDGANKETKALVRGLGKSTYFNERIEPQVNIFGIQELVDFGSTWNNLAITLQGTMEFSDMVSKMEAMIPAFPEYRELVDRLLTSESSINQISQVAKFRQDFSRTYLGVYELVFSPLEGIYKFIESTKNNIESIEDEFLDNFVNTPVSVYVTKDEFDNNQLSASIKDLPINTLQDRIKFLEVIGVKLTDQAIRDPYALDAISGRALSAIKNSLVKLIESGVKVTDPLGQIKAPNRDLGLKGESGNITKILRLESKYSRNNASASMQNAAGSTVYALSLNNFLTISNSYLSNVDKFPTYQDVVAQPQMRHLDFTNNPYVKNSVWLNQMFDLDESSPNFGKRKLVNGQPVVIDLINFNGLKVEQNQGSSEGEVTTGLWIGDKIVQDFNALLTSGVKEMMRAGDKASAFAVKVTGYEQIEGREDYLPVKIEAFSQGFGGLRALDIFSGYLADELTRMRASRKNNHGSDLDYYSKTAKNFNLFKGILEYSTGLEEAILKDLDSDLNIDTIVDKHQKALTSALRGFFNKQVNDKITSFSNYQFNLVDLYWVDKNLTSKYNINQLLRAYVVNAFILNVEQTKVFNGDGAFYKAFHKRNSKDTSTGTTMMTDQWFIDWLNNDLNTNLQSKLLGVNNPASNITNTVIFKDNTVASVYIDVYRKQLGELGLNKAQIDDIVSKYEGANEGDAQGWITLDFYRTFKLSQGKWFTEHEAIYEKASKGEALSEEELFFFMPIKAQYAGPLNYDGAFAPAFHKFSLVPLIPSLVKGTKMEALNEKMIRNNVGYALFESGSKVATILNEDGGKDSFYKDYKTRDAVDPGEGFTAINPIFNHYLKEQVNIDPSLHDEVIFGTQFRKLLFQNLFNGGKAINEKWEHLYKEYNFVIDRLVENEKQRLLEELGIIEENSQYKNVDFIKLVDKFVKEANRRDMNMNVTSFMEYDKDKNDFKYPLDASVNRQQVQNMIMSIINNRLVRQHTNGDLMVQVSSAGFEKYTKPTGVQLEQYGTNGLRFYHLKDGKTQSMQVKVPLNGDFANLLYYTHPDGQVIGDITRLNEALQNQEWVDENRKSIQMIGYRIPTQGLNSIEFMEIAEFLPAEAGNILILPTEIVTKAGSDFDIDKLSIFKPAIRLRYRPNPETGERIIERAFYAEPNFLDLTQSVESQKQELSDKYEPALGRLKDRIQYLRDSKYTDTRWYNESRQELRKSFDEDIINNLDNLLEAEYKVRELEMTLIFKKDDVIQFKSSRSIEGFDSEAADQLFTLESEVQDLYIDLAFARQERDAYRTNRNVLYATKRTLLEEAQRVIDNYFDTYYKEINNLQSNLDSVRTEYFNELEELRAYKKGLQNRIIEIGREVLEDRSNFVQLITPNDTGLIKPMIADKGGIKQKNGYPLKTDYTGTSIYIEKTQEEKFLAGLVGKKALGIAAVNNTFTQLFEQIGLQINNKYKDVNVAKPNTWDIYMRLLNTPKADQYDLSNVYDEKGLLKSEFISQMINAYVDVLNDDFIFYANAGLEVAPVIFYLKNAGVSTEKIFYFINHPVIKYYINNLQATKSFVHRANKPEVFDQKTRIIQGLGSYGSELFKSLVGAPYTAKIQAVRYTAMQEADRNPKFFSEGYLLNQINKDITQIDYEERSAVLGYFLSIQREANMLRKFQAANSYDTSTAATPVISLSFDENRDDVIKSGFIRQEYQDRISNTVIKPFNITNFTADMFQSLMPVTLGKDINRATRIISRDLENEDKVARMFTNDLMMFIFSNYVNLDRLEGTPSAFDYVHGNATYPSMFDKTVSLKDGGLIARIKNLKTSPNAARLREEFNIINKLRVVTDSGNSKFANITIYRGENTTDVQNSLIEQFSRLANFNDDSYTAKQQNFIRKTFRDLALFAFMQSGLNKSPISFTDIVPNELYTPLVVDGITKFQEELKRKGINNVIGSYFKLFKINNPELYGKRNSLASYKYKNYKVRQAVTASSEVEGGVEINDFESKTLTEVEQTDGNIEKTALDTELNKENLQQSLTLKQIEMQPDNIEKILTGVKTTTIRSVGQASKINIKEGEQAMVNFGGTNFYVRNRGLLTVEQAGGKENMLKSEGVSSESEFKYNQTKEWINGKGRLYVYDISPNPFNNINPTQSNLFAYGNLAIQLENRILDSRNSSEMQEVNEVLRNFTEQSKPCNQ